MSDQDSKRLAEIEQRLEEHPDLNWTGAADDVHWAILRLEERANNWFRAHNRLTGIVADLNKQLAEARRASGLLGKERTE